MDDDQRTEVWIAFCARSKAPVPAKVMRKITGNFLRSKKSNIEIIRDSHSPRLDIPLLYIALYLGYRADYAPSVIWRFWSELDPERAELEVSPLAELPLNR